jgi:hypothetical protein
MWRRERLRDGDDGDSIVCVVCGVGIWSNSSCGGGTFGLRRSEVGSDSVAVVVKSIESVDDSEANEEALSDSKASISISEWARVNLVVLISSSSGVRKDTRFGAGKKGCAMDILRRREVGSGLFDKMDRRLCETL